MTESAQKALEDASAAGDSQRITDAVAQFECIEQIAHGREHPAALINLINALVMQAEATGPDTALDRALDMLDRHEQVFQGHSLEVQYLASRGNALLMKAQRTGKRSVMRAAVRAQRSRKDLAPRGHPEHGASLFGLGVTLLLSGTMFGEIADLDEAVTVLEAVRRRPDSSADRAAVLSALGNARLNRWLSITQRDLAELNAALQEHRQAIQAIKPGDPNESMLMSDFGTALMHVGHKTGDLGLIEASVETQRRAAEATPPGQVRKAERLNNLASALLTLHEHTGDPEKLDEAISTSRASVGAADPGHIHRASCLYGLASGLFRRGELRRTLLDFDEAAIRARAAVEATPEGHAYLAMRLAFLAGTFATCPPSRS